MPNKKGITITEIVLSISIFLIIAAAATPIYGRLFVSSQQDEAHRLLIQNLRSTREKSVAGVNDSPHGVYFDINEPGDDSYTIYQGTSYATRDSDYDNTVTFDPSFVITTTLSGNEVNFAKVTGIPNGTGSILLSQQDFGEVTIDINSFGKIEEL